MTSEEVVALLGEPDSRRRLAKPPSPGDYFGPKPSAEYLALPEGTVLEVWTYHYFRETWTCLFRLENQTLTLVDKGYHHPSIVY